MEVMTEKLELQLDKSTWKTVKFGDVVKEPKENCKDPLAEGIEHVVGLEHITSGDIHLRNSASIEESTTFTKKFSKGDVLFGRRRAYLKKAAQSNFDGICSGDITVFRAKPNLLPELLPFIVNNEKFFDYAVKHSAGGLSPRVKFKDLANFEFLLPPKAEQARIAKLLWAMDELIEREKEVFSKINENYESRVYQEFFDGIDFNSVLKGRIKKNGVYKYMALGEISTLVTDGTHKTHNYVDSGIPFLSTVNLIPFTDQFNFKSYVKHISLEEHLALTKRCKPEIGDLLISKCGTIGRCQVVRTEMEFSIFVGLALVKPILSIINIDYLEIIFNTNIYQRRMELLAPGGTRSTLALAPLKSLVVPVPSMELQNKIVEKYRNMLTVAESMDSKILSSQSLQKSIINQVF